MPKETKRLYFEDPYQVDFEANVIEKTTCEQRPALILDRTCFYPESGGQPSDRGSINGTEVVKVVEDNETILHVLKEDILSKKIKGKVDWETRFDHMQQHAGQHILSQSFYELYKGETLSFHLGDSFSTVEIGIRKIPDEEVDSVEDFANEIVFQNREIKAYFLSEEKIKSIPLRKPPKKEGLIRVIEISDFDYSACGGTHPRRTGEIGLIKVLKWERIRDNVRFEFVCGGRALRDYSMRNILLRQVANRFTVGESGVISSIDKLFCELKDQRRKNRKIQEKILQFEAQEIIQNSKEKIITNIFTGRSPEEVRFLALNIIRTGEYVVLYGLNVEGRVHLVLACSESLGLDMRDLIPVVSPLIKGRGGGRSSLVELAGEKTENLELAIEKASRHIAILDT